MGTINQQAEQNERLHTLKPEVSSKKGYKELELIKEKTQSISYLLSAINSKRFKSSASNLIKSVTPNPEVVKELLKLRPADTLSARGYACVGLYYGFTAAECTDEISQKYCMFDGKCHSLKEIGKIVHVTPEHVSEIIVKTLRRFCNEKKWVDTAEIQTMPAETTATDNIKPAIAVAMLAGTQL